MCCLQAKPFLDPHGEMPTSRGGSLMMRAICFCHSPGPGEPWGGEWHSANQDVFTRRFPCQTPGPAPGIRCVEERNGFHSLAACCPAGRPVSYVEAIFSPAFLQRSSHLNRCVGCSQTPRVPGNVEAGCHGSRWEEE